MTRELQDPDVFDEITPCVREMLRERRPKAAAADHERRIAEVRRQIENFADAMGSGALRASPTLGAKLAAAEGDLERPHSVARAAQGPGTNVERPLADLQKRAQNCVQELERARASGDVIRARAEVSAYVGGVGRGCRR